MVNSSAFEAFIGINSGKPPVITPIFGSIHGTVYSKRHNYYKFDAGELLYDIKYDEWDGILNHRSKVLDQIYKATHQYLARKDVQRFLKDAAKKLVAKRRARENEHGWACYARLD